MGTDRAELRISEALEGNEENQDLQDPGELDVIWRSSVAKRSLPVFMVYMFTLNLSQ